MEVAPIPVLRPSYLMDQEEFQGDLVEAPANIFYQKVNASRATLQRMQFQWRSPSDNLLASPVMFLRCVLEITCPQVWSQVLAYMNVHGVLTGRVDGNAHLGGLEAAAHSGGPAHRAGQRVPAIAFAEGDALTGCCSSINFLFNGTSLGLNRTNRWFRDFTKCMISSDDSAKIYKSSGGRFDQKDQKGVAGIKMGFTTTIAAAGQGAAVPAAGGADLEAVKVQLNLLTAYLNAVRPVVQAEAQADTIAGITQDTGVSDRCRAFFSLLQEGDTLAGIPGVAPTAAGVAAGNLTGRRYLQVSWPVCVSPFNPWRGVPIPASCPYRKGPLAIPHLSAGGLDLLMEDFAKSFIRRLGRTKDVSPAGGGAIGANASAAAVGVKIADNTTPYLEIKYFRLSHTRTLRESYRWNCWQAQTFQGPPPPSGATAPFIVLDDAPNNVAALAVMPPIGKDFIAGGADNALLNAGAQLVAASRGNKEWQIVFDVINLAQIPSYLLISVPKLAESFSLATECAVIENAMRNLDHNLSIKTLKIIVNSARGAIDPSADITGFTDAERLWEMTKENANSEYFKSGGFRQWRDYGSCVLLSSSQFAPGLAACDGVSYPVQIQVEMTVQNRAVDVSALGINGKTFAASRAHALSRDFIRARAQVTALFSKLILSTSETSASTNYMSYPLDSSERLMNNAGALR